MESEEIKIGDKENLTHKMRENPWILSTFILGVLILILLINTFGITGNAISEKEAGEIFLKSIQSQGADISSIEVTDISTEGNLYKISFDYQNNPYPVSYYLTKDGKLLGVMDKISSNTENPSTTSNIPKSDKPKVELYVFTYCPYGLQMEKATIPVVKLLGNAIDFKIRQIGAMHGAYEEVEAKRQLCIEKEYPNVFLDYVLDFASDTNIGNCNGDDKCVTPLINSIFTKLGIDGEKITSCMSSNANALYDAEVKNSQAKGVSGSPTLLINDATASASRSSAGVLDAVCQAFNNAPETCGTKLSTASSSAGFGSGEGTATSASC